MSEMNMKTLSSDWYKKYMFACNNRLNSISVTPTEVRLLVECIDAHIAAMDKDAQTLMRFIFSHFGDVSESHHLTDEVVNAVRRIEALSKEST